MRKSILIIFIFLFLIGLAAVLFNQSRPVLIFGRAINEVLRPLESAAAKFKNIFSFWQDAFLNVKNIKETNIRLSRENLELYGKIAGLAELERENALLKKQAEFSRKGVNTVLAEIIGRDFQSNRSFIVAAGSRDGISDGMAVITDGNVVIGRVIDAGLGASKIQTVLDTQSRIAAITSQTRISGLARGLGTNILFDLIAKNKQPESDELLISSGTDGIWPRGLIIGKVGEIFISDAQVFNTADVLPLLNIQELTEVFIITNESR